MKYLLDTVAVVRHFSGQGKMGIQAATILDHIQTREDKLLISAVSQVGWATGLSLPTNLFSKHKGGGQSKPVVHATWLRCEVSTEAEIFW